MNQTINDIVSRHSVRAYKPDAVSEDAIKAVLEAGASAAHGIGFKFRKFTAIADKVLLDKVNVAIRDSFRNTPINEHMPEVVKNMIKKAEQDDADYIYKAPVFIIVSVNADSVSAEIDTTLSLGNMMVAAQSLGLGSCWMNQLPKLTQAPPVKALLSELEIGEDEAILGTLVIGYPVDGYKASSRAPRDFKFFL